MALLWAVLSTLLRSSLAEPAECVIESGFDYVGNDLFRLSAANEFECCRLCRDFSSAGCRAFSFNDFEGGSCWMKRGRGTVAVNAHVKSGILSDFHFSDVCQLEHGIDYVGNDIVSVRMSEAGDCCDACAQMPGCRAFTFTLHDGGTCFLKSAKGEMVVHPFAVSSQVYVEEATCGIEENIDYVGNDIGSAPAADARDCCALCEAFGGCRAFTWSDHDEGRCFFKNRKDEAVWATGKKSGQVLANPTAPSCAMEVNVEYLGNVIGNASSVNAYGCCSICMKTVGCRAFSWDSSDGGLCILKSSKGETQLSSKFMSAVV